MAARQMVIAGIGVRILNVVALYRLQRDLVQFPKFTERHFQRFSHLVRSVWRVFGFLSSSNHGCISLNFSSLPLLW